MKTPIPTDLKLAEDGQLVIQWSDQTTRRYRPRQLRDASPDAVTIEKKLHKANEPAGTLPILQPGDSQPLAIQGMSPVGHYAYQIVFSDGHSSGIYPFEYLYELGEPVPEAN